jgi:TPR repeat protein
MRKSEAKNFIRSVIMKSKLKKLKFVIAVVFAFLATEAKAEFPKQAPINEQQLSVLKEKAAHGDVSSEISLAVIYYKPETSQSVITAVNTSKDDVQSLKYFKQAAESGSAVAQTNVGFFYDRGKGVKRDYKVAMQWYQMAASQGYPWAQDMIGRMYRDGHGVPKDYFQAAEFFKKAALQRDSRSGLRLGNLYFTGGPDLPQNYEMAYFWMHIDENPVFYPTMPQRSNDLCCEKTDLQYYQEIQKHLTPEQVKNIEQKILDFKMPSPAEMTTAVSKFNKN